MEEKMSARFEDYDKAFKDKLTSDILKAVDDYWRYKSDKTRPTLAQMMAMENSDTTKKERAEISMTTDESMKQRYITCMWNLYNKFGLKGAQCYHNAMLNKFGIPYPATEEIMRSL